MAGHGGKRLGSGRKSNKAKELGIKFFEGVCSDADLKAILRKHLSSENPKISFEAAVWLADHKFGKAPQTLEHDGKIEHRVVSDL